MWTKFWDMNTNGCRKEDWRFIFIEADCEELAVIIFCNRFGHNPNDVTCTCCGPDYAISTHESLEEAEHFHLDGQTFEDFKNQPEVLVITKEDVRPEELIGAPPC